MDQKKIDWKRAIILGGAFMATCIGSGFATGSEFLSFFVTYGMAGALGAILLSLLIYYLFTKELLLPSNLICTTENLQILPLKCVTLRLVKIHMIP